MYGYIDRLWQNCGDSHQVSGPSAESRKSAEDSPAQGEDDDDMNNDDDGDILAASLSEASPDTAPLGRQYRPGDSQDVSPSQV